MATLFTITLNRDGDSLNDPWVFKELYRPPHNSVRPLSDHDLNLAFRGFAIDIATGFNESASWRTTTFSNEWKGLPLDEALRRGTRYVEIFKYVDLARYRYFDGYLTNIKPFSAEAIVICCSQDADSVRHDLERRILENSNKSSAYWLTMDETTLNGPSEPEFMYCELEDDQVAIGADHSVQYNALPGNGPCLKKMTSEVSSVDAILLNICRNEPMSLDIHQQQEAL